MTAPVTEEGIWFVYDGECPICCHAAKALRIKQAYGKLNLVNARESADIPLVQAINARGLDLDEGMVILADGKMYHGKDALKFMAQFGETRNGFMAFIKSLFWSKRLTQLMYPWLRGMRNWLLKRRRVGRIDNLNLKQSPTFASVFGSAWTELPPVFKKHYRNHPYSTETSSVKGQLDVVCKAPLLWFAPLLRLMGQIPAFNENGVPVRVDFKSDSNSKAFIFDRKFYFSSGKTYSFYSKMIPVKGNELVEIMRFGLGWRLRCIWDGEKVILAHRGYALSLFGHLIPLPLTYLLGAGNAWEYPIDDSTFDMEMSIVHPWWGKVYGYKGRFEVVE